MLGTEISLTVFLGVPIFSEERISGPRFTFFLLSFFSLSIFFTGGFGMLGQAKHSRLGF